jgi:uncharacterized protein (TIGR02444 family)
MANRFWNFSLAVYSAPGVPDECINLQDRFGIDVNVLLFCAYMGAMGTMLDEAEVSDANSVVEDWHKTIVTPLRGARRWLKLRGPSFECDFFAEATNLRTKIKATELEAEYLEQCLLNNWAEKRWASEDRKTGSHAIQHNVRLFLTRCASAEDMIFPSSLVAAAMDASRSGPAST